MDKEDVCSQFGGAQEGSASLVDHVQVTRGRATLRIEWTNWRVRKDKILVGIYVFAWLMFAFTVSVATYKAAYSNIEGQADGLFCQCIQYLCFGTTILAAWVVVIAIPVKLRSLCWSESIEVSVRSFSHEVSSPWARFEATTVPVDNICELFLGHCNPSGDLESFLTLNLFYNPKGAQVVLRLSWGEWLAPDIKVKIFEVIEGFVAQNAIRLPTRISNWKLRDLARGR